MKNIYHILLLFILFEGRICSQHYLFAPETSGFHIAPGYSSLTNQGHIGYTNIGFTYKGRFTTSFSIGEKTDFYSDDIDLSRHSIKTGIFNAGFSYLALKQQQHPGLFSLSLDGMYENNYTKSLNLGNNFSFGVTIYKSITIAHNFSFSPSLSYGGTSSYQNDNYYGPAHNVFSNTYQYLKLRTLLQLGRFFISPELDYFDDKTLINKSRVYKTIFAGAIIPVRLRKN